MASIHPTAIVDPSAVLGPDVSVGAFSQVGAGVRCGEGCKIGSHVILEGEITLGDRNWIGHGCIFGSPPQEFPIFAKQHDHQPGKIQIGNGNTFREYVTIHHACGENCRTEIGDNNFLMVGVHVGHNVRIGSGILLANYCQLEGEVHVEDLCILGGSSVFRKKIRVGKLAKVRGNTTWGRDIPPFTLAVFTNQLSGINNEGMRHEGLDAATRSEVRRAYNLLYRSGLSMQQAIERAKSMAWSPEATVLLDFMQSESVRGLCSSRQAEKSQAD